MSKAGQLWGKLSDSEKKTYNDMHDADVKRYEKQLKEWKEKGYYMMEGGIKSTDAVDSKKKKKEKAESKPDKDKKRSSSAAVAKGKKEPASDKKGKAAAGKKKETKKSDDDLDIEGSGDHNSEELEASD